MKQMNEYMNELERSCRENDFIDRRLYDEYDINQGLRDEKGNGVLTGLTKISLIKSFDRKNGVKEPCDGELWYRGYRVEDLIGRLGEDEMGYEKIAYLLLVGEMPDEKQFADFHSVIGTLMLGIPKELYTAIFAVARIVGWSAHRIEEIVCTDKIIRPAYMSVMKKKEG